MGFLVGKDADNLGAAFNPPLGRSVGFVECNFARCF